MKEDIYVLTEKELKVVYLFIDSGHRAKSYREIFNSVETSDSSIYRWFRKPEVMEKILDVGLELNIYDTVCDKVLLGIIIDKETENRDKISAIKTWNDLRNRVHTTIKLETETKLDFSNVKTEELADMVSVIMNKKNGVESDSLDN